MREITDVENNRPISFILASTKNAGGWGGGGVEALRQL